MITKNDILMHLHENSSIKDIQKSLSNLKLYAIIKKDEEISKWCEKELNGYKDKDIVPQYRYLNNEDWSIEATYNTVSGDVCKICKLENIVEEANLMIGKDKKNYEKLIKNLRKKKLLVKYGFNDFDRYPNRIFGEIYSKELVYLSKNLCIKPFKDIIFPKIVRFICNDSASVTNKIKNVVKEEIKVKLASINLNGNKIKTKDKKRHIKIIGILFISFITTISTIMSNFTTIVDWYFKYIGK